VKKANRFDVKRPPIKKTLGKVARRLYNCPSFDFIASRAGERPVVAATWLSEHPA
jgi:hypothetical protein